MYKVFINDSQIIFASNIENPTVSGAIDSRENSSETLHRIANSNQIETVFFRSDAPEKSFHAFLEDFIIVEAAGGVVRNGDDETLLIKRLGKWDLPKGKIESGESKEEAAVREVMEECAIPKPDVIASLPTTYHYYKQAGEHIIKPTYWYAMQVKGKPDVKPQEEEGITTVVWAGAEMLKEAKQNTYASLSDLMNAIKV